MMRIHATTVSVGGKGVVIRGAPGSGKSELALRLIDGAGYGTGDEMMRGQLVADDQTHIEIRDGALWASAPPALYGLLELRGQGFLRLPHLSTAPVALVVDLVTDGKIERLPQPSELQTLLLGVTLPRIPLDPRLPGAMSVIRAVLTGALITDLNQLPPPATPS